MSQKTNKSCIKTSLSNHIKQFFADHDHASPASGLYQQIIDVAEKAVIEETLIYANYVQAKAAKILGINRNTLRKKIKDLNLE